jgi:hypothetical protein
MTLLRIYKPHQFTMPTLPFGMKCFVINVEETGSVRHFCALSEVPLCSVEVGEVRDVLSGTYL